MIKLAIAGFAGAAIIGILGAAVSLSNDDSTLSTARFRGNQPPAHITMPDFALRDQNSRMIRTADLRGKVVVLTFLDTKCREACPIIAGQIAQAWQLLKPQERARAVAIAISTNPHDDSRTRIHAFLDRHRAETIRYLTGPEPAMKTLWHNFQILSSLESGEASTHSAPVRIYSPELVWLATQHPGADLTPRNLAHDIRLALARPGGD